MIKPWRVIITRPQAQAATWAEQLTAQDFYPQHFCLLEIRPLVEPELERAIQNRIMDFDLYHKAIFVSQNAVHYAMEWIDRYWPQMPMGVEFYAVGATTAQMLASHAVHVEDLAQTQSGGMTSEHLLQAPGLQDVEGQRIIIFRGQGGRGHMGDVLQSRGARVDYCELYKRCIPDNAIVEWQSLLQDQATWKNYHNVIALHSGESLEHLLQILVLSGDQQVKEQLRQQLFDATLLVPSERIRDLANTEGFKHILVASNATDTAMTQALVSARSNAG